MKHAAATFVLVLASLSIQVLPGLAQAPVLPFRVNQDGTVDRRDLMKLMEQLTASDRITDEELAAIEAKHEIQYGPGFTPTKVPTMPPRGDLYAGSVLLSDGVNHTLLPKDAILYLPDEQKDKVIDKPVGRLILWPDFLKLHRHWLRPHEVAFELATGDKILSDEQLDVLRKGNAIVVSVLQGHPIGFMGPKVPAASVAEGPGESGAAPAAKVAAIGEPGAPATPGAANPVAAAAPKGGAETAPGTIVEESENKPVKTGRFDISNRFPFTSSRKK